MSINEYGWNDHFEQEFNDICTESMFPGRIIADYGQKLRVVADVGEMLVNRPVVKGKSKFAHNTESKLIHKSNNDMLVAVGDWVALDYAEGADIPSIQFVLKRKTKFSRAAAGIEIKEQIVASNVDTVFLIQSLNKDFNMRRLERYMIAAWESGAVPVVVLTKSDCCEDVPDKLATVFDTAPGAEVHVVSCVTGEGISNIKKYFAKGKTVALLGSSGVGKSTLVNTIAGKELLKTQEIREDDSKGRHTTTHRELILLPDGGLVLDTPGMRALSLWEADVGMEAMFGDIEMLTQQCRFFDCKHQNEPGCAVQEALSNGRLETRRWESWLKLQKELAHLEAKKEGNLRLHEKQWGKNIAKFKKEIYKGRK